MREALPRARQPRSTGLDGSLMALEAWEVVIVGAGPAGLSAALILGRCGRRVLICDRGTPRSWASHAMHAYLSRDGVPPADFREMARLELARYPAVKMLGEAVASIERVADGHFVVGLENGARVEGRKVLLATGVVDQLPPIPDVEEYFGISVFPCPYCDGWECRDTPIAVFGEGKRGFEMARAMTAWSRDILLCTQGSKLSAASLAALSANSIQVETARILRLEGAAGRLQRIHFEGGRVAERSALFFNMPCHSQSDLARALGCQFTSSGGVKCGQYEATSVPGVFVAGNILRDVQLSIVAAAEGARAAFGINKALTREDFTRRASGTLQIDHPGPD
jgi:thioredoxin reductase